MPTEVLDLEDLSDHQIKSPPDPTGASNGEKPPDLEESSNDESNNNTGTTERVNRILKSHS
jgi:hypothetical protein